MSLKQKAVLLAVLLLAWGAVQIVWLWRGPDGKDPFFYTDPLLLAQPRPEIALRYLHVYAISAAGRLAGDLPLGAGLWALLVYLATVVLVAARASQHGVLAAVTAGVLTATCPVFLNVATVPLTDLPAAACALAALMSFERVDRHGSRWALAAGILLLAATRMKETALCVLPALLAVASMARPEARRRAITFLAVGFLLAYFATAALDLLITGEALALTPRSGVGYFAFNLKPHLGTGGDATLTDHLAARWVFPYSLLCWTGLVTHRGERYALPLALWSGTTALVLSWAISVSDFGAEERYVIPVLLPLLPLAGVWIADRARQATQVIDPPILLLGIGLLAAAGVVLVSALVSGAFPRKAANHLIPTLWCVAIAASVVRLCPKRCRTLATYMVVLLLCATTLASLYSARQMSIHAFRRNAQWRHLADRLSPFRGDVIGLAVSGNLPVEPPLRVHSGSVQWRFEHVDTPGACPPVVIADTDRATAVEANGFEKVAAFDPLPLVLFQRPEPARARGGVGQRCR